MLPSHLVSKQQVSLHNPAASKKKALETAAQLLAAGDPNLAPDSIYEKLIERERLGSTGLANGIALPHARMEGASKPLGALITLDKPIDFDSLDGEPVDLIFALLVPEAATEEHLQLLAQLAQLLRSSALCRELRQVTEVQQALALVLSPE